MRPGDVLLNLGGCDVHSRWCIAHAIDLHGNDDSKQPFVATWYRPSSGQIIKTPLELGCWTSADATHCAPDLNRAEL